ncbi:MAG: hypothetical protein HDS95_02750 [Bacteroidales bacterium]|nr:hypothetical protein [Bacteroidales bacterium]MBD5287445.1 hypothetical protein [Bacteroides sp.]MBD5387678.1 hypothetical protein [bacterium]
MKKFLILTFVAICALVNTLTSSAQEKLTKEELADYVAMLNEEFPQQLDDDNVLSKAQLINGGNQLDFVVNINDKSINSDEYIAFLKSLSKKELRKYFADFTSVMDIVPVPVSIYFIFKDGKKYRANF